MRSEVRVLPDPPFLRLRLLRLNSRAVSPCRSLAPTQPSKVDENGRKDELNTTLNDRRTHFIQADIAVGFVFFDNLGCNEMFEIFILDVS